MDFERAAEKQRQVQLPRSFKCRSCGKFQEPGLFANKELNTYRYKVAEGHKVNPTTAQLRCRVCAGAQLHELKCNGPCGKWLDLQKFSKSSRMAGGLGWCQNCVLWKEAAQPELIPQAPPQGDLAPDEDGDLSFGPNEYYTATTTSYYSDPEAGSGSDYDDYLGPAPSVVIAPSTASRSVPLSVPASARAFAPAPASASASASVPATNSAYHSAPSSTVSINQGLAATTAAMSQVSLRTNGWTSQAATPAAARPSAQASTTSVNQSSAAAPATMNQTSSRTNGWTTQPVRTAPLAKQSTTPAITSAVPPHLRFASGNVGPSLPAARKPSDTKTVSSVSNPYEGLATPTLGVATWGDLGAGRPAAIQHNAWDSNGQKHVQQRVLSDSRSEVGSTVTSASTATTITTTVKAAPPPPRPAATGRSSNWAKAVGSRNVDVKYNALDHQPQSRRQQKEYDSDDDM